jgi:hypothetical protein
MENVRLDHTLMLLEAFVKLAVPLQIQTELPQTKTVVGVKAVFIGFNWVRHVNPARQQDVQLLQFVENVPQVHFWVNQLVDA